MNCKVTYHEDGQKKELYYIGGVRDFYDLIRYKYHILAISFEQKSVKNSDTTPKTKESTRVKHSKKGKNLWN